MKIPLTPKSNAMHWQVWVGGVPQNLTPGAPSLMPFPKTDDEADNPQVTSTCTEGRGGLEV